MILHGYFRSTASWRVRIALGLKGLAADQVAHHLRRGEQRDPAYLKLNPQGLTPAFVTDGGAVLTQSLAICEYLDEVHPAPPLLPSDPVERARVRAVAQAMLCATVDAPTPPLAPTTAMMRPTGFASGEENKPQMDRTTSIVVTGEIR